VSPLEPSETFAAEVARIRAAYARRTDDSRYAEPCHRLALEQCARRMRGILAERGYASLQDTRILEIGCGAGYWLRQLVTWGALPGNLCGMDLLPERIEQARAPCPDGIKLLCHNAAQNPSADATYDLVLQSTVFTSILDPEMKKQVAREMLRVLSPRGLILWYDFRINNPSNPDVRGVDRTEIARLFPGCEIRLQRITLAPPLGRTVARFSPAMYRGLSRLAPLCSHYLGIIARRVHHAPG
jgi:ubiquinone/menaquinone biosynthesis C-methylase UbiE